MIVRTYRQCAKVLPRESIIVATDDARIRDVCDSESIPVMMTSPNCLCGTDRVAEVARAITRDVYINLQGDEPIFDPENIDRILGAVADYPDEVLNGYAEISTESEFRSPTIPKVLIAEDGRLLYASRAAVPTDKQFKYVKAWKQVCVYSFPRAALLNFAAKDSKSNLEAIEDIEILRFLEAGDVVRMVEMTANSIAVDVPEDVARVSEKIRAQPKLYL